MGLQMSMDSTKHLSDWKELVGDVPPTFARAKKLYRKGALKHHPDKDGDPATFRRLNEAFEFLQKANTLDSYDTIYTADQAGGFPRAAAPRAAAAERRKEREEAQRQRKQQAEQRERQREKEKEEKKQREQAAKVQEAYNFIRTANAAAIFSEKDKAKMTEVFEEYGAFFEPEARKNTFFMWAMTLNSTPGMTHKERQVMLQNSCAAFDCAHFLWNQARENPGLWNTGTAGLVSVVEGRNWIHKLQKRIGDIQSSSYRGFETHKSDKLCSEARDFLYYLVSYCALQPHMTTLWETSPHSNRTYTMRDLPLGEMMRRARKGSRDAAKACEGLFTQAEIDAMAAEREELLREAQGEAEELRGEAEALRGELEELKKSSGDIQRLEKEAAGHSARATAALRQVERLKAESQRRKDRAKKAEQRCRELAGQNQGLLVHRADAQELQRSVRGLTRDLQSAQRDKEDLRVLAEGMQLELQEAVALDVPNMEQMPAANSKKMQLVKQPELHSRELLKAVSSVFEYLSNLEISPEHGLFNLRDALRQAFMCQKAHEGQDLEIDAADDLSRARLSALKGALQKAGVQAVKFPGGTRKAKGVNYHQLADMLLQGKQFTWFRHAHIAIVANAMIPTPSFQRALMQHMSKHSILVTGAMASAVLGVSIKDGARLVAQMPPLLTSQGQGKGQGGGRGKEKRQTCMHMIAPRGKKRERRQCKKTGVPERGDEGRVRCRYHVAKRRRKTLSLA